MNRIRKGCLQTQSLQIPQNLSKLTSMQSGIRKNYNFGTNAFSKSLDIGGKFTSLMRAFRGFRGCPNIRRVYALINFILLFLCFFLLFSLPAKPVPNIDITPIIAINNLLQDTQNCVLLCVPCRKDRTSHR